MNSTEIKLVFWVVVGLAAVGVYRLVAWLRAAPATADPWDESLATPGSGEPAHPVCWRCLEPVDEDRDFCTHCGLSVGPCTNLSPYLYLFALGDGLRTGTSGRFTITPLTVAGFLLLSAGQYLIFAPVYWYFLVRNIRRLEEERLHAPPVDG